MCHNSKDQIETLTENVQQNLETYLMNRVRLRIAKMNILYGKLGKTNFLKHPPLQIKFMLAIAYNFGIN